MKAVIMCGGSGTRLWPISRTTSPKQFFKLFDNKSLFELTIERTRSLVDGFIIVVNEQQLSICQEQTPTDLNYEIIVETAARNTAPAIALAACASSAEDQLIVLPSDHLIKNTELFHQTIKQAQEFQDSLVTFGIQPTHPETGFGYIQADGFNVKSFKEKPDLQTAKEYLDQGNYFWNSGMFFFKASTYLSELKAHSSEMYEATVIAFQASSKDENHVRTIPLNQMIAIPKDSIDYAVMEKSDNVKVIPSRFPWNDLGSFDALYEVFEKDKNKNNIDPKAIHVESRGNLVITDKRLICTSQVENLIIVDTKDALLITKRGESQSVKAVYQELQKTHPDLLD